MFGIKNFGLYFLKHQGKSLITCYKISAVQRQKRDLYPSTVF